MSATSSTPAAFTSNSSQSSMLWLHALPSAVLQHCVIPLLQLPDVARLASTCSVWCNAIIHPFGSDSSSNRTGPPTHARFTARVMRLSMLQSFTQSPLRFDVSTLHLGSAAAFTSSSSLSQTIDGVPDWSPTASELTMVAQAVPHLHSLHTQVDFRHPLLAPWRGGIVAGTREFPQALQALHLNVTLPSKRGPLDFMTSHVHGMEQLLRDVTRCTAATLESFTLHIHAPTDHGLLGADMRFDAAWFQLLRPCEHLATFRWQAPQVAANVRHEWCSANHIAALKQFAALTELEIPAAWDVGMLEQLADNDGSSVGSDAQDSFSSSSSSDTPILFQLPGLPLLKPSLHNICLDTMALTEASAAQLARFPELRILNPQVFCVPTPNFLTCLLQLEEVAIRGTVGVTQPPVDREGRMLVPTGWMNVDANALVHALVACKKIHSLTLSHIAIQSEQLEILLPHLTALRHLALFRCKGLISLQCMANAATISHLSRSLESFEFVGVIRGATLMDPFTTLEMLTRLTKLRRIRLIHAFDAAAVWNPQSAAMLNALMHCNNNNDDRQCFVMPVPPAVAALSNVAFRART